MCSSDLGASRAVPGKSGLCARGEGERVMALQSWERTRASRRVEEGHSRSFWGVEFGERTRDCSPGHARKEGRHVAKMGASRGFSPFSILVPSGYMLRSGIPESYGGFSPYHLP